MKLVLVLLINIFILTACTNNSNILSPKIKNNKISLINKANNGNIKAMLELNKIYLFPQTKEGLELYNKWYPLVLKSKDLDSILEFISIFRKDEKMFINGKDKTLKLQEYAVNLGSQKALYELLGYYLINKNRKELEALDKKIVKKADQNQLITLRNIYLFNKQMTKLKRVQKYITKSDAEYFQSISLSDKLDYLHMIYIQRRAKGREYDRIIKDSIKSDDKKLISALGNFLYQNGRYYSAKAYLEKAIQLGIKNRTVYLNMAKEYETLYKYKDSYKSKIHDNLKKAALLDSYEATKELLTKYKKNKNSKAYLELKKEIIKLNESKRALADFFYKEGRYFEAYKLFDELALKNNTKAIITLARSYKSKSFNPEKNALIDKWKNFVLNSKQVYLKELLKPYLIYREDIKFKEKITKKQIENNNITTLKELAQNRQSTTYIPRNKSISYLKKAASFGDIESKYLLADKYSYYGEESKKRISIYKQLIKQGDIKAYKKLAIAYGYAPSGNTKEDVNKSLYYYKKAYENGDKSVLEDIISYYICPDCSTYNEKQGEIYINKAIENKDAKLLYKLGGSYKLGEPVKKDIKRSEKYYRKAYELGYSKAYYDLALIYKDEYKNEKEAFNLLKKCSDQYQKNCTATLGYFYQKGIAVKKDINKAMEYYNKVAYANSTASYNLAGIYFNKKDYRNALKYFKKTYSINKNKNAAYYIAKIYHKGKGSIQKDLKLAKKWYKKAGTKKAKNILNNLKNK